MTIKGVSLLSKWPFATAFVAYVVYGIFVRDHVPWPLVGPIVFVAMVYLLASAVALHTAHRKQRLERSEAHS